MASAAPVPRWLWPLAVGLAAFSMMGLECQFEPLGDARRGFVGDLCRRDGTCEPCRRNEDGGCATPGLICAAEDPPRCRVQCVLGTQTCSDCGPEGRCAPVLEADGGLSTARGVGACVPAAAEGDLCTTEVCAGCLLCATEDNRPDAGRPPTCRRVCDLSIDAGPPGTGITGPHPYCQYADLPETGALVLQNCCLYGQSCTPVVGADNQTRHACFGPLPGQAGSTCRPQVSTTGRGTCDTTALCVDGDTSQTIPDHCLAAGGLNQPCRSNNTCDPSLTCIADARYGTLPLCRRNCDLAPAQCATCGPSWDCVNVIDPNGNPTTAGVCVPAVNEGAHCEMDLCAQCLVCGGISGQPDAGSLCRRPCRTDIDAGPPTMGFFGPHTYCEQPDPDGGPRIMINCCPEGEACLGFSSSGGAACYAVAPVP